MDQLTQKQLMREQLLMDWYNLDTTKPLGETFQQFVDRINMNYVVANPPLEDSGIIIPDYPEDCDIYVMNIEASKQALVDYKATLDECIRFDNWANPLVDPLRTDQCTDLANQMDVETAMLEFMDTALKMTTADRIDALATGLTEEPTQNASFMIVSDLGVFLPVNWMMLSMTTFRTMINNQFTNMTRMMINNGSIVPP